MNVFNTYLAVNIMRVFNFRISHLIVIVGHNKSYPASGRKRNFSGSGPDRYYWHIGPAKVLKSLNLLAGKGSN